MFELVPFRRNNLRKRDNYFNEVFNNFFDDDFFNKPFSVMENPFKVDLKETEDSYLVEADLPGVNKEAIDLTYDNNYLTISAKRDDVIEENKENYVRRERHYGEFKRCFYVDNVDENKIQASFENGVLKIDLPKLNKGKDSSKKIDIH